MMTRIFGGRCCCAIACGPAIVTAANSVSRPAKILFPILMFCFLQVLIAGHLELPSARSNRACSERFQGSFQVHFFTKSGLADYATSAACILPKVWRALCGHTDLNGPAEPSSHGPSDCETWESDRIIALQPSAESE